MNTLLEKTLGELGFSHFGLSALEKPLSFDFYREWLDQGLHGDMNYLKEHAPIKERPQSKWPRMQSALVFAIP
jgi:epoxyqueuosine reductase